MSIETHQTPAAPGHGDYERRDISARGIFYFLAGLAVAAVVIHLLLAGFYDFLDKRERARQPQLSPLISNAPADTRKVSPTYPETAFPQPRLETDERNQLVGIRTLEEQKLSTYDWADQKAGTVRIPIERAMDLLVQRGLPTPPQAETRSSKGQQKGKTKESSQ